MSETAGRPQEVAPSATYISNVGRIQAGVLHLLFRGHIHRQIFNLDVLCTGASRDARN